MKGVIWAATIVMAGTSVAAAAQDAQGAQAAEQQDDSKKICRTEKATGSLTRRNRICLTQAQWREVYDRTRRGVGDLQGSGSGAPACISAMDAACGAPGPGGSVGM